MYKVEKEKNPALIGFIIALLMVVPLTLGVIFAQPIKDFINNLRNDDVPTEEIPTEEENVDNGIIEGESIENGLRMKVNRISTGTMKVDVSYEPDTALFDKFVWNIEWKDEIDTNFNIDYFYMEVSEDTKSCQVYCDMPFTKTLLLKCVSESNPDVYATLDLEFVGRNVDIIDSNINIIVPSTYNIETLTFGDLMSLCDFESYISDKSIGGTISGNPVITFDSIFAYQFGWTETGTDENGQYWEERIFNHELVNSDDKVIDYLTELKSELDGKFESAYNLFLNEGVVFSFFEGAFYEDTYFDSQGSTVSFNVYFDLSELLYVQDMNLSDGNIIF